ncbi:oxalate--CoA ligase [Malassezia caprae]|uniref:Oxalate--CoA ligase n=1 Tax=Malassezia caprae TaxID=1381934 RepID=A0AAF0E429_9BASI|nr:oxalate--CoA ligase [Malassezia caprae]
MLARLLQHCKDEVAMDGEQGSDTARLFGFAASYCEQWPESARPPMDDAYRAFLWRMLMADGSVQVGLAAPDAKPAPRQKSAPRQSILAKGRGTSATATPRPLPANAPHTDLRALQRTHGADLRVYMDADHVRRTLTGSDAPFVSAAAYDALQLVCRARERGLTVVELGAATQYDQKTVYYLVKLLVERQLVTKFAAPEMGHVSNYVVSQRYLERNPQWRAQQDATLSQEDADVGEPAWVDMSDLAQGDKDDDEKETSATSDAGPSSEAWTMPPPTDPHEHEMLAFPPLSEEQSAVWLHSRQDLLARRLWKLLAASTSHMTPRRWLSGRLGLRPVPTLRRGFLSFLNRHVAAGHLERVRVQFPSASPLYVRATEAGLATHFALLASAAETETHALDTFTLQWTAPLEAQLLRHIHACGVHGCTMQELACHFHFSNDIKRMVEQILARQVPTGPPPYAPLAVCAPFEQEGRERRIRYYAADGFAARCARDGLDMAAALGYAAGCAGTDLANVPETLPGEAQYESAAALHTALQQVPLQTVGFFRDTAGPVALRPPKRKAPIDPTTGRAKRGRPRKGEQRPPKLEDEAPVPEVPHDDAWQAFEPAVPRTEARANLSSFQRSSLLAQVLSWAGGALDETEIPRRTKEFLERDGRGSSDLADRATRTKAIEHAVQRGLVQTIKVPRSDDLQRPRTVVHLTSLAPDDLGAAVRRALDAPDARGGATWGDVSAEHAGLAGPALPAVAPWSVSTPVAYGQDDPLDDPATQHAFAKHSLLLRQYYGFAHGAAARLALFHDAAWDAAGAAAPPVISLDWFVTQCPLRTFVALVPVRLRSAPVVRAVTQASASVRVQDVPSHVAKPLGLLRKSAHRARLATYVAQLVELGLATQESPPRLVAEAPVAPAADDAPTLPVATAEERAAYWAAVRERVAAWDAARVPPYLGAPHAWRTDFALRGIQKAFLRRYAPAPPPEALPRLAAAIFAPVAHVEAFFAESPAPSAADTIARKVREQRAERAAQWAAALADVQAAAGRASAADAPVPRGLAALEKRFVHGRETLDAAALRRRIAAALGVKRLRAPAPAPATTARARRTRRTSVWTPAHQDLLRDAYVIVRDRLRAWRAWHASIGEAPPPDDWSALAQLAQDETDAWHTWRARRKQLATSPREQVRLSLLERAWHEQARLARQDGSLVDPAWPHPTQLDLRAHVQYLRAHVDAERLLREHAATAAHVVLPRTLTPSFVAQWVPWGARGAGAWPSDAAPMVHRLQALRERPLSLRPWLAAPSPGAPHDDALAVAAAKMLVPTVPTTAEVAAFAEGVGATRLESAIAALVAQRVVRHVNQQLVYTDEHVRALQGPWPMGAEARAAYTQLLSGGAVQAHPAATEGETAAFIALLARGDGALPALDRTRLDVLRARTKLNARTLDDIETECAVTLQGPDASAPPSATKAAEAAMARPVTEAHEPAAHALVPQLLAAGAAGVPLRSLPAAETAAVDAYVAGYDEPRLVHPRFVHAWQVRTVEGAWAEPRAWFDVHGHFHASLWAPRYALVVQSVCGRPGVTLAALAAQLAGVLDRRELVDLLAAAGEAAHVRLPPGWARMAAADVCIGPGTRAWFE